MKTFTALLIRVTLTLAIVCIVLIGLLFVIKATPVVIIVRICIFLSFFFVLVFGSLISLLLYQLGQSSEGRLALVERRLATVENRVTSLEGQAKQ